VVLWTVLQTVNNLAKR